MLRCISHHARRNLDPFILSNDFIAGRSHLNSISYPIRRVSSVSKQQQNNNKNKHKSQPVLKRLSPITLASRLKDRCERKRFDEAESILKTSPLDAQNVVVWNTLIWECMKGKRYEQAYSLYTDMKRRGFSPNTRTYNTMLKGYTNIEDWRSHQKQSKRATSVYQSFCEHLQSLKSDNPTSKDLDVTPIASYIKVLGQNGLHQEIFDVFYEMDTTGPLAPNEFIFEAMFRALSNNISSDIKGALPKAASAKLLWTTMLKQQAKNGFPIDSYTVCAAITVLARGRPVDQKLALDITREYFGLESPGQARIPAQLELNTRTLGSVLEMCSLAEEWQHVVHFYNRVSEETPSILDHRHVQTYIFALAALNIPERASLSFQALERLMSYSRENILGGPAHRTFMAVLRACGSETSSDNWRYTTGAFDLMTGYHTHDFMDGSISNNPRKPPRNAAFLPPSAEALLVMLQTAHRVRNFAHVRQVLRLVHHISFDELETVDHRSATIKQSLAETVFESVNELFDDKSIRAEERGTFVDLRKSAEGVLKTQKKARDDRDVASVLKEDRRGYVPSRRPKARH